MLRYQWIVADRAAQRVVSLPDFSLPTAADLPGVVDEHASLLQLYQRRRQRFFRQSVQEVLVATFEGVCERDFGSAFALQSYPEYLDFFRRCAVPWVPDFLHAPIDQGSLSGLGMGPRYVILVTKNEAKNEAGCYQNRIASYFKCLSGIASCNLVILKIT